MIVFAVDSIPPGTIADGITVYTALSGEFKAESANIGVQAPTWNELCLILLLLSLLVDVVVTCLTVRSRTGRTVAKC